VPVQATALTCAARITKTAHPIKARPRAKEARRSMPQNYRTLTEIWAIGLKAGAEGDHLIRRRYEEFTGPDTRRIEVIRGGRQRD